jgi:hypothetical protein
VLLGNLKRKGGRGTAPISMTWNGKNDDGDYIGSEDLVIDHHNEDYNGSLKEINEVVMR